MRRMVFLFQSKFLAMKSLYRLFTALFIILLWNNCKKEHEIPEINRPVSEQLLPSGTILTGCDDTTAFKSSVDLQPLEYLKNCYVCTAVKQVPGLGEIPWKSNCYVSVVDNKFRFAFYTYEPWFEELLLREALDFVYIPMNIGVYPVDNWVQNHGGYSRWLADGDVLDAAWETDTSCLSYIEITRFDLEDREIEGNFEIHLKMFWQGAFEPYSERINFLNGKFKAEIEK
jgi:hypothetical protein